MLIFLAHDEPTGWTSQSLSYPSNPQRHSSRISLSDLTSSPSRVFLLTQHAWTQTIQHKQFLTPYLTSITQTQKPLMNSLTPSPALPTSAHHLLNPFLPNIPKKPLPPLFNPYATPLLTLLLPLSFPQCQVPSPTHPA